MSYRFSPILTKRGINLEMLDSASQKRSSTLLHMVKDFKPNTNLHIKRVLVYQLHISAGT